MTPWRIKQEKYETPWFLDSEIFCRQNYLTHVVYLFDWISGKYFFYANALRIYLLGNKYTRCCTIIWKNKSEPLTCVKTFAHSCISKLIKQMLMADLLLVLTYLFKWKYSLLLLRSKNQSSSYSCSYLKMLLRNTYYIVYL